MSIHYFHCTDGRDVVLDRRGRRVEDENVEPCARLAAIRLINRLPGYGEWSSWTVAVHDEDGRCVAIVPFPAAGGAEIGPRGRKTRKLVAGAMLAQQGSPSLRTA